MTRRWAAAGALLVALVAIGVGVAGLMSPDGASDFRRLYFATPTRLYLVSTLRMAMGLVVMLAASRSRAPKTLLVLGAVMGLQGVAATLLGPDHARAVMEWENAQGVALLRVGFAIALATGAFVAFAVMGERRPLR